METSEKQSESEQWGLSLEAILGLRDRLSNYYDRYRLYTWSQTDDTSEYGLHYLSSLMRMESKWTMANIARTSGVAIQNIQQFISDSPWSGPRLVGAIQQEISARPEYATGSVLVIDESADAKSGPMSAGSGRQYNGRLGKVDLCQVGVFLALTNNGYQTWIDGELYLPQAWFAPENASKRQRIGIPDGQGFATKLDLALKMVKAAQASGMPFEAVDCDALYGRKGWFRDQLAALTIEYYADVPENTRLYLEKPLVRCLLTKQGKPAQTPEITGIPTSAMTLAAFSSSECRCSERSASNSRWTGGGCTKSARRVCTVTGSRAIANQRRISCWSAVSCTYCWSRTVRISSKMGAPAARNADVAPPNRSWTVWATSCNASGLPE